MTSNLSFSTKCGHVFHTACIESNIECSETCPLCPGQVLLEVMKLRLEIEESKVEDDSFDENMFSSLEIPSALTQLNILLGKRERLIKWEIEGKEERIDWMQFINNLVASETGCFASIKTLEENLQTKISLLVQNQEHVHNNLNTTEQEKEVFGKRIQDSETWRELGTTIAAFSNEKLPPSISEDTKIQLLEHYQNDCRKIIRYTGYISMMKSIENIFGQMLVLIRWMGSFEEELEKIKDQCYAAEIEKNELFDLKKELKTLSDAKELLNRTPGKRLKKIKLTPHCSELD